jgi:hypothetical protein
MSNVERRMSEAVQEARRLSRVNKRPELDCRAVGQRPGRSDDPPVPLITVLISSRSAASPTACHGK